MPRVTVIIATFNWSSVLPYSIGSVLRQTMSDFEVLVVGDGCTDDSEAVVASIGDPRVRWINLPSNTGHQSGPNNEGLRQAKGELIAYLGHDDLWLPHHLSSLVTAIERSDAGMVHSLIACVSPDGEVIPASLWPEKGLWGPPSCTLHRKLVTETAGGWRDYREIDVPPEVDLWRRVRDAGFQFMFVPRLTAIKFPASMRRAVYKMRPCHEQAAWSARIETEPDFEPVTLARMIADGRDIRAMPYREMVRHLIKQTFARFGRSPGFRAKLERLLWIQKHAGIDAARKFKGL
jgi:glycosyltransferase involved in cell wall biosynthesis